MAEFILVSIVLLVWIIFALTIWRRKSTSGNTAVIKQTARAYQYTKPETRQPETTEKTNPFSSQVTIVNDDSNGENKPAFSVMVQGQITVPEPMYETEIQVLMADITQGQDKAEPILCTQKEWQMDGTSAFCFRAYNGKIPQIKTDLTGWVPVAAITIETLNFPRKGNRKLKFVTSLISKNTYEELACATTIMEYSNEKLGYIDVKDNANKTEILTLQLAIAVSGFAGLLETAGIETLREWIEFKKQHRTNIEAQKLENLLNQTIQNYENNQNPPHQQICAELMENATIVDIYDAMDLCLRIISAGGTAQPQQTELISQIANSLEVDEAKFRAMTQKILPIHIHQHHDLEFIFGITAEMTSDHRRQRLNAEYQKWNARVTHPDREIQTQADQMLTLIAEARSGILDAN